MEINLKFDTEKSINSIESDKLRQINNYLVMGYNGWESIIRLKEDIPLLKEMYEEEMQEMQRGGNCGIASCLCSVIRSAFYDLKYYKEHEEDESEFKKMRNENYNLKREVERLERQVREIKELLK